MENNLNKSKELEQEMVDFTVAVVKYTEAAGLPRSIADQLIRAAGGIGANYVEALNASSKTDFRNKVYISKKEAAATRYWLKISAKLSSYHLEINHQLTEQSQKFLMILQKTVNTINDQGKTNGQHIKASRIYGH